MERSQYLARALEQMGQPQAAPTVHQPDLGSMKVTMGQRHDWEAKNPGQSYLKHTLGQAGSAIMGAPQNALSNLRGLLGGQR